MPRKANTILPSADLLREFFDYDPLTGLLTWRKRDLSHFVSQRLCNTWNRTFAGKPAGWTNANGYLATKILTVSYLIQRIVWKIVTGDEPPEQIDHIDGNRTNNRFENLRGANALESARNRTVHKNNKLGLKGVTKRGNTYISRMYNQGKDAYIGTFKTAEEASEAYERKSKEIYGKFYRSKPNL